MLKAKKLRPIYSSVKTVEKDFLLNRKNFSSPAFGYGSRIM